MPPHLDRHVVTAVLIAHEGARWLPETLKALLTQTRPVDRLVAADTGSSDTGPAMLAELLGEGNLLTLPPQAGYADAVAEVLAHPASTAAVPVPDGVLDAGRIEWIWLVHDDSAPAADALERLLLTAESRSPAVILGPKLRDWDDHRVLLEAGVAIDRAGRRETGLDRRELDQGQHDTIREVMAVSTAGMLVRRDVWDELGGLDRAFGLFRDDVDFGWRAYAAGHRVLIAPDAVMYHAEAAAQGRRDVAVPADDRRNALLVLLVNPSPSRLARTLPRVVAGSLLRALWLLIAKRPAAARGELRSLAAALVATPRLRRARGRGRRYADIGRFQPRWPLLRRLPDLLAGRRLPTAESGTLWRLLRRPVTLLALGLTAVTLAAEWRLLTAGALGGGALVPAWGGASDLWAQYISGWHPVGLGSAAGSPPYVGVLAVAATLFLGKPWLAVTVLLLAAVPLAGLSAYAVARRMPRVGTQVAVWAGVTYALLPVATGAVATGRIGTLVALVLLPLVGLAALRALAEPARHAAWAAALLLTVATAFAPFTWVLVAIAGLLAWYGLGAGRPYVGRRLVIALAVPPLLLFPWTLHLVAHPSGLLREAGLPGPVARPSPEALMMLNPGGPGTPPAWVAAGLAVTALGALLLPRRRTAALTGWLLALPGLLAAILLVARSTWPGAALAFACCGVVLAASCVVRRAVEVLARGPLVHRAGAISIVVVAAATPLLAAGAWVAHGSRGPLGPASRDAVPVFVESQVSLPRMLVLRQRSGTVTATLVRDRLPTAGEETAQPPEAARRRLRAAVAALAAGADGASTLARFGVQYVLVPDPDGDPLVHALDAVPDLTRLGRTRGFALWQLTAPAGRLMLLDGGALTPLPSGRIDAQVRIPPGRPGRTLLLAESADGGWRATLGGRPLRSRTLDGWAQAYDVPQEGGEVTLRRDMWWRHAWVLMQAMGLALTVLLALPAAQPERGRRRAGRRRRIERAGPVLSGAES